MLETRRSAVLFVWLSLVLSTSHAQSASPNQNTYFIQGAVNKPGVYQIENTPSFLKLVGLAGGLTDRHGAVAFIIRRLPAQAADQEPAFNIVQIRIDELFRGNFGAAGHLEPGDMVNIPPVDVFFVAGEVKTPGSFSFTEGVSLLQAIARAHGVKPGAKADKTLILRQDPNSGKREQITVDLDAVMSRKQKDIPLLPNDIIVVPRDRARTLPFLDAPPIRLFSPCRNSGRCLARLDLNLFEAGD